MTSSPIQSLYVLTDSACAYAIDVLHDGATSVDTLADTVVARLGTSRASALAVIDGLVQTGFAERTGNDSVVDPGLDRYCELMEDALDHVKALERAGETEHAHDIVGAIDAAFNGRSVDARLRWAAARFHDSESGRRHAARVAEGSLGVLSTEKAAV